MIGQKEGNRQPSSISMKHAMARQGVQNLVYNNVNQVWAGGTVFMSVWPAYTLEQLEFITCMRACKLALALLLSLKGAYVDARFISRFIIATSDCCALAH